MITQSIGVTARGAGISQSDIVTGPSQAGSFGISQSGLPPAPSFFPQLKSNILLNAGSGSATFTRATVGYVADHEGLLKQAISGEVRFTGARRVANVLPTASKSEDLTTWGLSVASSTALTLTFTASAASMASSGALRIELNGAANRVFVLRAIVSVDSGTKGFRLGVLNTGINTHLSGNLTATTAPQIFSATVTVTSAIATSLVVQLRNATTADAGTINITKVQIEEVTGQSNQNPAEYVSVGVLSSPYHGAGVDGVRYFETECGQTVSNNVVTEATGAAIADATLKGYLAEGARTNRCLYSSTFENAAWVSGGGGITADDDSAVSPTGATNASTLTAAGANGTLIQDLGVVASSAKTGSLYLKRKTGSGDIDITMDGGSTWTTVAVTSSWVRFEKTQTLANEDFGIRIVTSGDAVYAWNGQVETAAFASSPIPTTTIAVARNADVPSWPFSGNASATAGTVYAELMTLWATVGANVMAVSFGNSATNFPLGVNADAATTIIVRDGTNLAQKTGLTSMNTGVRRRVSRWGTGGLAAGGDGAALATNASFDGDMGSTGIAVGCLTGGSGNWFGNIRNVRIWTTALSDLQIAAL